MRTYRTSSRLILRATLFALVGIAAPVTAVAGGTCDTATPAALPFNQAEVALSEEDPTLWLSFEVVGDEPAIVAAESFSDTPAVPHDDDVYFTLYSDCIDGEPQGQLAYHDDKDSDDWSAWLVDCLNPGTYYLQVNRWDLPEPPTPESPEADTFGLAVTTVPGVCAIGSHTGAEYEMMVPEDWNGVLLVYSHGYSLVRAYDDPNNLLPTPIPEAAPDSIKAALLARGYALAGSAYGENGFAVDVAIQNTHALTTYFGGVFGQPDRTIIWGRSMGGLVATALIENYPELYDAAIPFCGAVVEPTQLLDYIGAIGLVYHAAFGWPQAWGSHFWERDPNLVWYAVLPHIYPQVIGSPGLWEFIRHITGAPAGSHWTQMLYTTHLAAEGDPSDVASVSYQYAYDVQDMNMDGTNDDEIEYLAGWLGGRDRVLQLVADVNDFAREAPAPSRSARNRVDNLLGGHSGDIHGPVLTVHNMLDSIILVSMETAYRDLVETSGNEDLLVQLFHTQGDHCGFQPEAYLMPIDYMIAWLDDEEPPDLATFVDYRDRTFQDIGFALDYESPAWPLVPIESE